MFAWLKSRNRKSPDPIAAEPALREPAPPDAPTPAAETIPPAAPAAPITEAETPNAPARSQLPDAIIAARRQKNHAGVLENASQLRAIAPKHPLGYSAASAALRALGRPAEAADIAAQGLQACPNAPALLREAAEAADAIGDTALAQARFAALRALQPQSPDGYLGAIELSRRQAQPLQTQALLQEGLAALPHDRNLRLAAARNAARTASWDEAAAHWNILLEQHPEEPALALEAAMSAIGPRQGRQQRMPDILKRLIAIQERFPAFAPAYTGHIQALREADQLDEAAASGQAWRQRFPDDRDLAIACARVAEAQGNTTEALSILTDLRARSPASLPLEIAYCRCLSLCGQNNQAEQISEAALLRFPGDDRAREQHVGVAASRGDYAEAARRAEHFLAQSPESAALRKLSVRMIERRDKTDGSATQISAQPQAHSPDQR